ncbi:MAG: hypothetical protein FWF45_06650 [Coriobacteriia bacterium]|nr:hypothetical protein [Coriobacteriia bacterium]
MKTMKTPRKLIALIMSSVMILTLTAGVPLSVYATSEETTGVATGGPSISVPESGPESTPKIKPESKPAIKQNLVSANATSTIALTDVCEINGTGYSSLDDALADITDNTPTTIKLLADIVSDGRTITDRNITFDLDSQFNLTFESASSNINALTLNGSNVNYLNRGTGSFQATSFSGGGNGLAISGGSCALTHAEANSYAYDGLRASDGAVVTVNGNVKTTGNYAVSAYAASKSSVTVNGNVITSGNHTVCVTAQNASTITVTGNLTATGMGGWGVNVASDAIVTITGDITTANGPGISAESRADVTLTGNITSALGDGVDTYGPGTTVQVNGSIEAAWAGVKAQSGSAITVDGPITTHNGDGVDARDPGTAVTVTGDIDSQANGVYANNGAVVKMTGTITTTESSGIYATDYDDEGTLVTVVGNVTVNNKDSFPDAVNNYGATVTVTGNLETTGKYAWCVNTDGGGVTTVNGNLTTADASGITAWDEGTSVVVNGNMNVTYATYTDGYDGGLNVYDGAKVLINGLGA